MVARDHHRRDRQHEPGDLAVGEKQRRDRRRRARPQRRQRGDPRQPATSSQTTPATAATGQAPPAARQSGGDPLPPLKPSQTGNRWPRTAPSPDQSAASGGPRLRKTPTANAPFPGIQQQGRRREAFVPGAQHIGGADAAGADRPESPSPAIRVSSNPNGTEPNRYPGKMNGSINMIGFLSAPAIRRAQPGPFQPGQHLGDEIRNFLQVIDERDGQPARPVALMRTISSAIRPACRRTDRPLDRRRRSSGRSRGETGFATDGRSGGPPPCAAPRFSR